MSFRTVVISNQSRISYKNRFLIVKSEEKEAYVHLSEIDTIIVDSISTTITTYLLKELSDNKINIIFCDDKHNPFGEIQYFYSRHNSSKKILLQTKWKNKKKDELWASIIKNKIFNQAMILKEYDKANFRLLTNYINEIVIGDKTNREGHAAKMYFNALFGRDFIRNKEDNTNAALNYGYAILLSNINKEITSLGYITQLGIHHKNEFNEFNLACDLMESFRPIIDLYVFKNNDRTLDNIYKLEIIDIFNSYYKYRNKRYTLKDIIKMYTKQTLECLEQDANYQGFYYEG